MIVTRFYVDPEAYQRPSASMNLFQWRLFGGIIRADHLAWSFTVMRDDGYWNEHFELGGMMPTGTRPVIGDHGYCLFAHDWRTQSASAWVEEKTDALLASAGTATLSPSAGNSPERAEHVVLSRPEFDAAVRDALRALWWPSELDANPLSRTRLVVEHGQSLGDVLRHAVDVLLEERGGDRRHQVLTVTYGKDAPTQEAAARRLGMSFSTYRRHLAAAVKRVSDVLWSRELS